MFGLDGRIATFPTEPPSGSCWPSRSCSASGTQLTPTTSRPSRWSPAGVTRAGRRPVSPGSPGASAISLTLFVFGLPILLLDSYLPERAQQGAEMAIAS